MAKGHAPKMLVACLKAEAQFVKRRAVGVCVPANEIFHPIIQKLDAAARQQ